VSSQCPTYSNSLAGSTVLENCICDAKYFFSGDQCVECPKNSYCAGHGLVNTCPAGARSFAKSTSIDDCTCPAGQYLSGDSCLTCPVKSYCPGDNSKIPCPSLTTSPSGSSADANCKCEAGKYRILSPSGTCKDCPKDSYCTGDNNAQTCPNLAQTNTTGALDVSQCMCAGGYYLSKDDICVDCSANYYCPDRLNDVRACPSGAKSQNNSFDISHCKCPAGQYLSGLVCLSCTTKSYCPGDNIRTECPTGATSPTSSRNLTDCICPASQYLSTDDNKCIPCTANSYCPGQNLRQDCPTGSTSSNSSSTISDCLCSAGSYLYGKACLTCPANAYCPGNNIVNTCPSGSNALSSSNNVTACTCPKGQYLASTACVSCPANLYCNGTNITYPCPSGSTSSPGSSNISSCFCSPGRYLLDGSCLPCPINSYCPSQNRELFCPPEASSNASSTAISDCICKMGYYLADLKCLQCTASSYCPGNNVIKACPMGAYSPISSNNITNCTCPAGQYLSGISCLSCSTNSYCIGDNSKKTCPLSATGSSTATSPSSSKNITDCFCPAGQYLNITDATCVLCDEGYFCPGQNTKSNCPVNAFSPLGSSLISNCICIPGKYLFETGCLPCPTNSYCPGTNLITTCPSGASSGNNSYAIQDCICPSGQYLSGSNCLSCLANTYCPGNNSNLTCPLEAKSEASSTKLLDCICPIGKYLASTDCLACRASSYCQGDNKMRVCPTGATSLRSSEGMTDCNFIMYYIMRTLTIINSLNWISLLLLQITKPYTWSIVTVFQSSIVLTRYRFITVPYTDAMSYVLGSWDTSLSLFSFDFRQNLQSAVSAYKVPTPISMYNVPGNLIANEFYNLVILLGLALLFLTFKFTCKNLPKEIQHMPIIRPRIKEDLPPPQAVSKNHKLHVLVIKFRDSLGALCITRLYMIIPSLVFYVALDLSSRSGFSSSIALSVISILLGAVILLIIPAVLFFSFKKNVKDYACLRCVSEGLATGPAILKRSFNIMLTLKNIVCEMVLLSLYFWHDLQLVFVISLDLIAFIYILILRPFESKLRLYHELISSLMRLALIVLISWTSYRVDYSSTDHVPSEREFFEGNLEFSLRGIEWAVIILGMVLILLNTLLAFYWALEALPTYFEKISPVASLKKPNFIAKTADPDLTVQDMSHQNMSHQAMINLNDTTYDQDTSAVNMFTDFSTTKKNEAVAKLIKAEDHDSPIKEERSNTNRNKEEKPPTRRLRNTSVKSSSRLALRLAGKDEVSRTKRERDGRPLRSEVGEKGIIYL